MILWSVSNEPPDYEGFDDSWDLIDPHTNAVVKTVSAKTLWVKLIQNRVETGEPYIMFGDTVDEAVPEFQRNLDSKCINQIFVPRLHFLQIKTAQRYVVCQV